ncbi:transposase [Actinomadura chokoriensis]|uniref:Transposase n=1 Tax=Actinomadura chokoriensis TaxID=454156 RepID=A0ABV4QUZ3_9ACTN
MPPPGVRGVQFVRGTPWAEAASRAWASAAEGRPERARPGDLWLSARGRPATWPAARNGTPSPAAGRLQGEWSTWIESGEKGRGHRLPVPKSLVNRIRQDFDAVTAGLSMRWISGRVEGNVHRIERIKRDGYGRASFELLRLRILHAD